MRSKGYLTIIITLIATLGLIGLVEGAKPDKPGKGKGPQGLEGRTFLVEVWNPATVSWLFTDCYHFSEEGAEGAWYDEYFGLDGTWYQESKGSKGPKGVIKSYTAAAGGITDTGIFGPDRFLLLEQSSGGVTTAGGILQLSADLTLTFDGGGVVYELVLFGWENADCELD